jgi:hypothetical protein
MKVISRNKFLLLLNPLVQARISKNHLTND